MKFSYTEYYDDNHGKEKIKQDDRKVYKNPVEIVIRIEMEQETYERRKLKYKDPIWSKVYTLFQPKNK